FAEVLFLGIAGQILERHDGDRRSVVPAQVRLSEAMGPPGALLLLQAIDAHGPADVLEVAFSQVGQLNAELVPHVVAHGSRHHYLARARQLLDPRRDVDSVTVSLVAIDDHVLDVDTDAQHEAFVVTLLAGLRDRPLNVVCPAHGGHRALELDEQAVAHYLQEVSPALGDFRLQEIFAKSLPLEDSLGFVRLHELAEAGDVGKGDGGEAPLYVPAFGQRSFHEGRSPPAPRRDDHT